jgi:Icc-related predicted phosphoesterase
MEELFLKLMLYASDLHGTTVLYEELLALVANRKPSLLILGGDLLPKSSGKEDLYSAQHSFLKQYLLNFFDKIQLDHSLDIGIMLGNDDFLAFREELAKTEHRRLFHLIDDNTEWITSSGWRVIGFNLVPETPFPMKDLERRDSVGDDVQFPSVNAVSSTQNGYEATDTHKWFQSHPFLSEELENLPRMTNPEKTIFVAHAPPYDTPLDVLINGKHVGSKAIKTYIERTQPFISLHGHIHESPLMSGSFETKIGNTICINPGQIHYPKLDAILFNLDDPTSTIEYTGKSAAITDKGIALLKAPFGQVTG